MEPEKSETIFIPTSSTQNKSYSKCEPSKKTNHDRKGKVRRLYRLGDVLISTFVVFPLVIGFWRGIWQIMDYYSDLWGWGPWGSIILGHSIPFVLYFYQESLKKVIKPGRMNFALFYTSSRCLLTLHAFGSVNQWRGCWKLMDNATGLGVDSAFVFFLIGTCLNLLLKTFNNVLAPPLLCCVDEACTIHDCALRFRTPLSASKGKYFGDCVFSVFVVPSLTVCCWRGVWNSADVLLYPEDPLLSAMISLGIGIPLCLILCTSHPSLFNFVSKLQGFGKGVTDRCLTMLQFVGCVFAWRGVWNSYDLFIVFDTPILSEWITTLVGILGALLLGCISTVVVRGVSIDGEHEDEWTVPYFSHLRTPNYDVPFPEPWMCRCLCTNQRMNLHKISPSVRPISKANGKDGTVEDAQNPLTVQLQRLPPPDVVEGGNNTDFERSKQQDASISQTEKGHSITRIPYIDGSSEDDDDELAKNECKI